MTCLLAGFWEHQLESSIEVAELPPACLPVITPPQNAWKNWNVQELSPVQCTQAAQEAGCLRNWQIAKLVGIGVLALAACFLVPYLLIEVVTGLIIELAVAILSSIFVEVTAPIAAVLIVLVGHLYISAFLASLVVLGNLMTKIVYPEGLLTVQYFAHLGRQQEQLLQKANQT